MTSIPTFGYPVAIGVLFAGFGIALWHYCRKSVAAHRFALVFFAIAFFYLVMGVKPLFDALARLTAGLPGIIGLLIITGVALAAAVHELRIKRKEHRVHGHLIGGTFAVCSLLIIGNSARLLALASHSPARTATALARSVRSIHDGTAAHSVTTHQALTIALVTVAVAIVLVMFGRRHEKRPLPGAAGSAGPKAITGGRPALPGRPVLPGGKQPG